MVRWCCGDRPQKHRPYLEYAVLQRSCSTRRKENKLSKVTSGLYIGVEYKWAHFFSLSINQVRDIAKCVECLPSMYGCPAVEPSKQDSVVLCTYNPNTWETVAEKLPTVSSISAWTTYWAMVRTCSQTHISILSYRLNILRSF